MNVESTPPGATVYVDSASAPPIGVTPLRSVRIPRGSHTLIFRAEGHEEGQLPVTIRRRRETFRIILNPLGTISIAAGNEGASNAAVRIDGQPVGNVPYQGTVQPGRHLVQVGREGYVTFTQWVEVSGGQILTLPVLLEADRPDTGSILVAGDVTGAPVYLDGDPRGVTPTVIENVPVGERIVEIRPDGMGPWRETVRVVAGERINLNPEIRGGASSGSLRVIANVPGARIRLDGMVIGEAPAIADSVPAGEHILEAEAAGYSRLQQPITVEGGQQRVVSLRLEPDSNAAGRIIVRSAVANAVVTVDGEERGPPPVVVDNPTPGIHTVVVNAEGYETFRQTCEVRHGMNCEIDARLQAVGTPVYVEANAGGAQLYLDGTLVGPLPYEGNLPAGQHTLEVRAPGRETHTQTVNLTASPEPRRFNIAMVGVGQMTAAERQAVAMERQRQAMGATSHAAAPLAQQQAVLDASVGWIYPLELRLGVGITDWLEGGFAFRSLLFRYNEFELRGKIGYRPLELLSVAGQVRVGGGLGPSRDLTAREQDVCNPVGVGTAPDVCQDDPNHQANSFFLSVEALGSIHFAEQGAFTLWMAFDFHTDGYDWRGDDVELLARSEVLQAAGEPICNVDADTNQQTCSREGRQTVGRFRIGGSLDLVLSRHWNLFVLIEGVIGPSRDILGDFFGFGPEDTQFYARLGTTHKF